MKTLKKISFFLPNFNIGGVEKSFIKMANHFEKKGFKVEICFIEDSGNLSTKISNKVSKKQFKSKKLIALLFELRSYFKKDSTDIFVSSIDDKSKATLATGLPAKGNFNKESMSELSNELVSWKKVRMIGSAAMSCAYVASGQFDQYQEKGIFLWDIAAGLSIIKAAGGNYTFKSDPEDQFKVDVVANNNCL